VYGRGEQGGRKGRGGNRVEEKGWGTGGGIEEREEGIESENCKFISGFS